MGQSWRSVLSVCVSVAAFGFAPSAMASVIDFDNVTVVGGFQTFAADLYRPQGLVFSDAILISDQQASVFFPTFLARGGTSPNALVLGAFGQSPFSVDADIVIPGTSTPTVINFVQVDVFDGEIGTNLGTLEAFDSVGNLIGSVSQVTPASEHALYTISTPGIARLRFSQDIDGGIFDNLVLGGLVPEPMSLFLLTAGGLAILSRDRA